MASDEDEPLIGENAPTYRRAWKEWKHRGESDQARAGEALGVLHGLIGVERDMIAALDAARSRHRDQLWDHLRTGHADRVAALGRAADGLGGLRFEGDERPGMLPRDAEDIEFLEGNALIEAVEADHCAVIDRYEEAQSSLGHHPTVRSLLEKLTEEARADAEEIRGHGGG